MILSPCCRNHVEVWDHHRFGVITHHPRDIFPIRTRPGILTSDLIVLGCVRFPDCYWERHQRRLLVPYVPTICQSYHYLTNWSQPSTTSSSSSWSCGWLFPRPGMSLPRDQIETSSWPLSQRCPNCLPLLPPARGWPFLLHQRYLHST